MQQRNKEPHIKADARRALYSLLLQTAVTKCSERTSACSLLVPADIFVTIGENGVFHATKGIEQAALQQCPPRD